LQNAFKALVQHCNPQFNMESIEDLLGFSRGDAKESGPQMHSSTSIHAPDHGEVIITSMLLLWYCNLNFMSS
jgi:hypothetical protein